MNENSQAQDFLDRPIPRVLYGRLCSMGLIPAVARKAVNAYFAAGFDNPDWGTPEAEHIINWYWAQN